MGKSGKVFTDQERLTANPKLGKNSNSSTRKKKKNLWKWGLGEQEKHNCETGKRNRIDIRNLKEG